MGLKDELMQIHGHSIKLCVLCILYFVIESLIASTYLKFNIV